jgi:transposase-like protein
VYPQGVSRAHTSQRVQGLAVRLYLLGLSYGAVALALEALGVYGCNSRVYDAVQQAAARLPGLKREAVFAEVRTPALGSDVTSVKCQGQWLLLGLSVDALSGLVLTLDGLAGADAATLQTWVAPIAAAVGAQVLVSDDADTFKTVADELGLAHQVCKSQVQRNTQALIETWKPLAERDAHGCLAALGVTRAQAVADLERLGALVHSRLPGQQSELRSLHLRYLQAQPPSPGGCASLA